ncbi:hypothetical protein FNX48_024780, partial [Streptomyces sp. IF17]|nr:hypothetical protein [Streptomyces alkaliphilus]
MAVTQVSAPRCGLLHIRTKQTKNFTILPNSLAQRRGSATAGGIASYLFSLKDGTLISIDRLCEHFDEGRTRIRRGLAELERDGWIERRPERAPDGTVRTRVVLHDVPRKRGAPAAGGAAAGAARPPKAAVAAERAALPGTGEHPLSPPRRSRPPAAVSLAADPFAGSSYAEPQLSPAEPERPAPSPTTPSGPFPGRSPAASVPGFTTRSGLPPVPVAPGAAPAPPVPVPFP